MDAVKFLQERARMCKSMNGDCNQPCPITNWCGRGKKRQAEFAHDIVSAVEAWSAAHPRKTRQDVFLEQWPEGGIDSRGCLMLCPKLISADYRKRYENCTNRLCADCRKEFWGQEVE